MDQSFEDGAWHRDQKDNMHRLFGKTRDPIMQKHDRDESAKVAIFSMVNW